MATPPGPPCGPQAVRRLAASLLPVVRRTLQTGDGPLPVLSLARTLGIDVTARAIWSRGDERLARTLARRAGRLLIRGHDAPGDPELAGGTIATAGCAAATSTVIAFGEARGRE